MRRYVGSVAHGVAGTAVLVSGHPVLACAISERILEAVRDRAAVSRLRSAEEAKTFFRSEYYFAYGTNMSEAQMKVRCPTAVMIGPGVVHGYQLVFNRRGSYRPGAVASILRAPEHRVYGVIWRIGREDMERLDEREDPSANARERITAFSLTGETFDCFVYVSFGSGHLPPDTGYLGELIKSAQEASLPPEYVDQLRRLSPAAARED